MCGTEAPKTWNVLRPVQEWFNINKLVTDLKPGKVHTAFYTKQLAVTVTLWHVSTHPQTSFGMKVTATGSVPAGTGSSCICKANAF